MKEIKKILFFIFGAIYTSCIWIVSITCLKPDWTVLPLMFLVFSTVTIIIYYSFYLAEHWDDN
jgi:hypothetical protein